MIDNIYSTSVTSCRCGDGHPRKDILPTGTTTRTEHLYRAHQPDGRIRDTEPMDKPAAGPPFGRLHLPEGTRVEHLTREVTVTVTAWMPTPDQPARGAW